MWVNQYNDSKEETNTMERGSNRIILNCIDIDTNRRKYISNSNCFDSKIKFDKVRE